MDASLLPQGHERVQRPVETPCAGGPHSWLKASPALSVWVVGHTDNVGAAEANLKLSAARAAAVIRVLTTKMPVDARRLAPFGHGPYSPVANNGTEDGRAKNRRVEPVAQP